jgi:hypothetical protein
MKNSDSKVIIPPVEEDKERLKDIKRQNLSNQADLKRDSLMQALKDFFKPYNLGFAEDIAIVATGYIAKKALEMKCHLSNENLVKLLKGEKTDFVSYQAETIDNKPYMKQSMLQLENHSGLSLPEFIYKLASSGEAFTDDFEPNPQINFYKWDEKKEVKPSTIFSELLTEQQVKELQVSHYLVEPISLQLGKDTYPSPYKVFVNEKSGEISALKFNPLVNRLASVLMNYPQIGQKNETEDTIEDKENKKEENKNIIIELMAGKVMTYMKGDKEVSLYFDPIKNRIEAPYTSVYKQQHFKSFVTEQKIMSEDMMINKHQALQFTINKEGITNYLFFEPFNKENPISVNQLYSIIQQSSKGKGLGIDKIPIQEANESALQIEMRVIGKALLSTKMHKDRFVVDFSDVENTTIVRRSLHEAKENLHKTERQIEVDLHLGSPNELMKTITTHITTPELSNTPTISNKETNKVEQPIADKVEKAPKQPKMSMK